MKKLALVALATAGLIAGCGGSTHKAPHPAKPASQAASAQPVYHSALGDRAHSPTFGLPPTRARSRPLAAAGLQTREMFDSITLSTVPANPFAVAGYTSGIWPTYLPMVRAYPHAVVRSIAINNSHHAQCLDVEPGDAVPSQAGPWVRGVLGDPGMGVKSGTLKVPCIYTSLSEMPAVKASLNASGLVHGRDYLLWDANWTYQPHLDQGYDATQWTDRSLGRNLDESTVTYGFLWLNAPGQKPSPPPKPKPKPVDPYAVLDTALVGYSTHGQMSEYRLTKAFDQAGDPQVRVAVKPAMRFLADRVYRAAFSGRLCIDVATCAHPAWNVNHRGERYQLLSSRAGR